MTGEVQKSDLERVRVLFTGTGERMIENLNALVTAEYEILRCLATETDFTRALNRFKPHLVIVCLQTETREMLRVYDILCMDDIYKGLPVIAIGYEDDCKQFSSRIPVRNLKTLRRPFNPDMLTAMLKTCEESTREARVRKPQTDKKNKNVLAQDDDRMFETDQALIRKIERLMRIHGRKNVLVVDDDVNMLNVIKLYLQDLYDVTVVPSGKLALKYIAKKPTDMILLDYMMPDMDGPEVLQQIRESSPIPDVPVLFLTGVSDKDRVLRGLEFKPNGYLLKPVAREALLEKVTEVVLGLQ